MTVRLTLPPAAIRPQVHPGDPDCLSIAPLPELAQWLADNVRSTYWLMLTATDEYLRVGQARECVKSGFAAFARSPRYRSLNIHPTIVFEDDADAVHFKLRWL